MVSTLIKAMPDEYGTYYEPMVGGGALFFELQPSCAVLSDINRDLINFYEVLRNECDRLTKDLLGMVPSKDDYYRLRDHEPSDNYTRALRFAYLNRLCWNGLFRVNQQGKFNVPFGGRVPDVMWDEDHLATASRSLAAATLKVGDFPEAVSGAVEGDIVFFDPPYPRGSANGNGFDRYSSRRFGLEEHIRLSRLIEHLRDRAVDVVVVLANKPQLLELYPVGFRHADVSQKSLISADPESRKTVTEIVLKYTGRQGGP